MNYYNYKHNEIKDIPTRTLLNLIKAMHINQARDSLQDLESSQYPKMKLEDKRKVHRRNSKVAFPNSFTNKNIVKLGDINKALGG